MTLRLFRLWWLQRVPPLHARLVLLLGLAIRFSGILMLAFTLPAIWGHMAHPWWSALLALVLAAENAAVAAWWLARRRPDPRVLWLDLPTGAAAILIGTWLAPRHGAQSWALFVYPNTVLLSFVTGMLCRGAATAFAGGALWASADVAATLMFRDAAVATAVEPALAYLVNPLIGWRGGSMLRRNEEALATALAAEVRDTAELAATAQKWRLATALHDGVLQTLETLRRSTDLVDPGLREQVTERATWLRRYIETGHADQSSDFRVDLDAVVTAARQAGIVVEMNAARLLAAEDVTEHPSTEPSAPTTDRPDPAATTQAVPLLAAPQREAMVEALFQTISAFGTHPTGVIMVRAVPDRGGVFMTVLSTGDTTPTASDIADVGTRLESAGGWLKLAPVPCVELWVPGPDQAAAAAE
ncbi:hypothetical protein ABH935_009257 [Catenulispora sp. GAS73]|uniref:hypothetical protein n=1 Tax=Catenulispora sp. GAS73 TaxID=3156269 RepID=UPI003511D0C2